MNLVLVDMRKILIEIPNFSESDADQNELAGVFACRLSSC